MKLPILTISFLLFVIAVHVHSYPQNGERDTSNFDLPKGKSNNELNEENDGFQADGWDEDTDESSEELEEYVEDDMIISTSMNRNGVRSQSRQWPGGVIHYHIDNEFGAEDKKLIKEAMDEFHKNTCIRFEPYTGEEKDYVKIRATTSRCNSHVGRAEGRQNLNLAPACRKRTGTIIHELMHAVGFYHEQSRSDRDEYIEIKWENIMDGKEGNFKKYDSSQVNDFGVPYDYDSVMHYRADEFSRNGKPTIVVKSDKNIKIGQRRRLSVKDIQKIRKMYNCK